MASGFDFPIFISSTHYNLVDLRAELASFLEGLGYRPVLSSEEGFPDSPPQLKPWESCLEVLRDCLIAVIIVDDRYGKRLSWPNYKDTVGDDEYSPTHGEFRYARATRKPMLIFIREHLMRDYQRFRQAVKDLGTPEKALEQMHLPDHVDKNVLDFIQDIKTTKPISWFHEFRDIRQMKTEIQRQLLNELAKAYRVRDGHIHALIHRLNNLLESMSDEDKLEHLKRIGCAKESVDKMEEYRNEIVRLERKLEETEGSQEEVKKLEEEMDEFHKKYDILEQDCFRISPFATPYVDIDLGKSGLDPNFATTQISPAFTVTTPNSFLFSKCPSCGGEMSATGFDAQCPQCNRMVCSCCIDPYAVRLGTPVVCTACRT